MSVARITQILDLFSNNGVVSGYTGISTINIADFYARRGWIWRLTGTTTGASKISIVTPEYKTKINRIPFANIQYSGDTTIALYEGGTAVSDGSSATPINALRESQRISLMTCKTGVTYSNDGTVLEAWDGSKTSNPTLGLWYLKESTQYVVTLSAVCNYRIEWAEVY